MRFDLEAFRQAISQGTSLNLATLFAGGGVALATLVVIYGAVFGADDSSAEVDAVAVSGPVFRPVAVTAPVPVPAVSPSGAGASVAPAYDDPRSIAHAVQTELKRVGCYGGPVNGIWTASTRAAMGEFTARVNAQLPVDRADPVLLALIETHRDVSCTDAPPPHARSAEVAGIERTRGTERREEASTSSVSDHPHDDAGQTRYSNEDRRALDTLAAAEPEQDGPEFDAVSTTSAAAVAAAATRAAAPRATKPERRRTSRKYKRQPSLSRQVSRGFRSLQRSLNKLF